MNELRFRKGGNKTKGNREENMTVVLLIILAPGIACILVCAGLFTCAPDNQSDSSSMHEIYASAVSKEFVKVKLTYPNDAKFPWGSDSVEPLGDNRYRVKSHVDAQNIFGAKMRKNYVCVVKYIGGDESYTSSWRLESLSMD